MISSKMKIYNEDAINVWACPLQCKQSKHKQWENQNNVNKTDRAKCKQCVCV